MWHCLKDSVKGKRGYIISYADWFKGFVIGIIIGAIIVYLFMSGMIPANIIPYKGAPTESPKLFIPLIPFLFKK